MTGEAPIGVFDSGIGGVSVLHAIRACLPRESLLYCADHARLPWGDRGMDEVRRRSRALCSILLDQGAKAIVIACNTATAAAAEALRGELHVPVIGMEPAVKPAVAETESGVIGVLGTGGTLASARFSGLLQRYADGLSVITRPSPELVDLVETTLAGDPRRQRAVDAAIAPLIAAGADVVVLGCTHFAFLRAEIEVAIGDRAVVIDTAPAVARQLARTLDQRALRVQSDQDGAARFLTSGDPAALDAVLAALWPGAAFEALAADGDRRQPGGGMSFR